MSGQRMTKVAILGANGQVGAELCLLLRDRSDIDLVPICRNRSGSAFLRWQGISCRHGRPADPKRAAALFGDCDVIVNSSLATGTPSEIRNNEDGIIHNMFAYSKAGTKIIHFSTQSVYGDPDPRRIIRWRNPYGRVKIESERQVRKAQRRFGKDAFILRLGHVCGRLQEISNTIREEIRSDCVVLPDKDCSSNTVYTVAIIDAVDRIIQGQTPAGTYDCMNSPAWTWRQVYEFEAAACERPMTPTLAGSLSGARGFRVIGILSGLATALSTSRPMRNLVAKLFAYVPKEANARALAWWYVKRAAGEISALNTGLVPTDHLSWVANGVRPLPAATPTIELLKGSKFITNVEPTIGSWPDDLPNAAAGMHASAP
jgi:nucleoside-diphosphate-sugar epimerase